MVVGHLQIKNDYCYMVLKLKDAEKRNGFQQVSRQ